MNLLKGGRLEIRKYLKVKLYYPLSEEYDYLSFEFFSLFGSFIKA
jgi:hypothetical protein